MTARVDETLVEGFAAVRLDNRALRVTVVPELGAKVVELTDKTAGRDVFWHNPRTTLRRAPYGAYFDDWWSGGWDEIFPSGDRGVLHGETLPYMGEMWAVPWTSRAWRAGTVAYLETSAYATVAPARITRTLSLRADEPIVRAHYRIDSLDVRPLPYVWGIHPAFAAAASQRIDHPGREMLVGVSSDPSMGVAGMGYTWPDQPDPHAPGQVRDARRVRAREAAVFGGHWATNLAHGWLALTDTTDRHGVAVAFETTVFKHAWLWQVYGGWRGHHHVCLEPWTGYPMQLDEAIAAGRASLLAPAESIETDAAFLLYQGVDCVQSVDSDGDGYAVR